MHILALLFLLLLDGIFSAFTVFENLTLVFRWNFVVLRLYSIARERAVMKCIADSWLDRNDFVIHSSGFELCINHLYFLCRFLKYFSYVVNRSSFKTIDFSKFSCRGRNVMKEDRCGCHWSGVTCPVNLKRKARLKFSFCSMHEL